MRQFILAILIFLPAFQILTANNIGEGETQTITEKVSGLKKFDGFFNFYWSDREGKIYLEVDRWKMDFLAISYLSRGMGSNDVGLDRGKIGAQKVVSFFRSGNKVLLIQPNLDYRADSGDSLEVRAVSESFATSVIWGFTVTAEEEGKVLIDITDFLLSDQNHIQAVLKYTGQGSYRVDDSRSALNMDRTKNFPDNTEFDVLLTYSGENTGRYVRQVVPSPEHITLGQHISFVKLPDLTDYQPRIFMPESGFMSLRYMDLATAIGQSITKRYIYRHRLVKKDPSAAISEAIEPIVYYLDPGTPEPVRTALLEGASWWSEAFEAIGYKDAYQVKMLPPDADPLDIRYNVIQWVHRSTRGWSYGSTITDPRTGQILKGHVSLGSQRVRQDYLIAEALLSPYEAGEPVPGDMQEMALARLRQLSAHEVGHTLGFQHNYIASADGLSSVMDYPHPLVTLKDDSLSLEDAYDTGIGEWDKVFVAYGYQDFPGTVEEEDSLKAILEKARTEGLRFLSDRDARGEGSAHPHTHLWDNSPDAVAELERIITVRHHLLKRFSEKNIREGIPYSELERVLVPAYMFHRYQLEAAAKTLGGMHYNYALRGEELQLEMVSPADQLACLDAVLKTIEADFLAIPEEILEIIPPKPLGYRRDREHFISRTGVTFDPLAATESAADQALTLLFNAQRATRIVENHARAAEQPGLQDVLDRIIDASWHIIYVDPYLAEIQRATNYLVLHHLMMLASDRSTLGQVRAIAAYKLDELEQWIKSQLAYSWDIKQEAHFKYTLKQISYFHEHPEEFEHESPLEPPPGQPIGDCGI
jgi:hypothetical protein